MNDLTSKQRVKANAALALIHANGHDANAVSKAAKSYMAIGHGVRASYEKALDSFVATNPDMGRAIRSTIGLVEASDDATVARYDTALNSYIQHGDETALNALAPMVAHDSVALALRNGEITAEDVASGTGLEAALGFTPADAMTVALSAPAPAAPAPAPTDQFGWNTGAAVAAPPPNFGPTGYTVPAIGERAARWQGTAAPLPGVRTPEGGYRAPMTGERAARWQGTPVIASDQANG